MNAILNENSPIDLFEERHSYLENLDKWVAKNPERFTDKNEKSNLKVGDTIQFISGYDDNILFSSKIFAFNAETGNAYVYWDCYWVDLDLEKRLYKN